MIYKQVPYYLTQSLFQGTTSVLSSKESSHVYLCVDVWRREGKMKTKQVRKRVDRKAENCYSSYFLCTSFAVSMRNRCSRLDTVHQPPLLAIFSRSTANCLNTQTQSQGLTINTRTCEGMSMHRCAHANENSFTTSHQWRGERKKIHKRDLCMNGISIVSPR